MDIFIPEEGEIEMNLCDAYGKPAYKKNILLRKGDSKVTIQNVGNLPIGMYILRTEFNNKIVQNKLFKTN